MQRRYSFSILALVVALFAVPAVGQERVGCRNFTYQEEAQAVYEQDPRANRRLDRDRDGVACEHLPSQTGARQPTLDDLTPAERRRMGLPVTGVADGALPWLFLGALMIVGTGLASRLVVRHGG
jgi:hypothetical protein